MCVHLPCASLCSYVRALFAFVYMSMRALGVCLHIQASSGCVFICPGELWDSLRSCMGVFTCTHSLRSCVCVCLRVFTSFVRVHVCVLALPHSLRSCVCRMRCFAIYAAGTACVSADEICSEETVRMAESEGFFPQVLECVYHNGSSVISVGSQACLAQFIDASNAGIDGQCREYYQELVDGLYEYALVPECAPENIAANNADFGDCIYTYLVTPINTFHTTTGHFPQRFCAASEVRTYAKNDAFTAVATFGWAPHDGSLLVANVGVVSSCSACYSYMASYMWVHSPSADNASLIDECQNPDGPTSTCLASELIINARNFFEECAGWDIFFKGPVCTAENVATVQTLIPAPYFAFATCAYKPATGFCSTIQSYLDAVQIDTNSADCTSCYNELRDDFAILAEGDVNHECRTDIFSEACLVYQAGALTSFETCAGTVLNTDRATAAPATTLTPETTPIPETTPTTTPSTETAATTTKSAASFTVLAALVAISLF